MRRLLVTGGAGFIGSNFVRFWSGENPGDGIVILDALTYAGNLASLRPLLDHPGIRFVRGDICDQSLVDQLLRDERIDTVVHFAAESHVDRSIVAPDAFIQTNVIGTHSSAEGRPQRLAGGGRRHEPSISPRFDGRGFWLARTCGSGFHGADAIRA